MNRVKTAVREVEAAFPDRDMHSAYFRQLVDDAFAADVGGGKPVAFLYVGQTRPEPTQGFTMQLAVADPSELLSAVVNAVRLAKSTGKIDGDALDVLIEKFQAMRKED